MTEQELQAKKERFEAKVKPLAEKLKKEKTAKQLYTRRRIEHLQEEQRLRSMIESYE